MVVFSSGGSGGGGGIKSKLHHTQFIFLGCHLNHLNYRVVVCSSLASSKIFQLLRKGSF
jgi:hypothetical protein